ncbi:MAG: hypothetical protein ACI9OJ_000448 [Myxococcota bacterium]|jgi:hypothetical protein
MDGLGLRRGRTVIVAPEPSDWLEPVRTAALALGHTVTVIAPWRRPGYSVVRAARRLYVRSAADRRIRAQLAIRATTDHLAARTLPAADIVVAPSLAAKRVFARARREGMRTLLVSDIPHLGRLHQDLDTAVRLHPESRLLRRFRASRRSCDQDASERALADCILVRGRYAEHAVRSGQLSWPLALEPAGRAITGQRSSGQSSSGRNSRLLLAGLATARSGTYEALELLEQIPSLRLSIRVGDGAEPRELANHARVDTRRSVDEYAVCGVVAPGLCESYPPEVRLGAWANLPVIATAAVSGFVEGVYTVPVGDTESLVRATRRLLSGEVNPARVTIPPPLVGAFERLMDG